MTEPMASDLDLRLPRPQYVSVPEALITSLAWSSFSIEEPDIEDKRKIALVYRMLPRARESRTLAYVQTMPQEAILLEFAEQLEEQGVQAESDRATLAAAVVEDLGGVMAGKGGLQAAIPMTPALGMMQNMRGLQAAANPPAIDKILERMFALGSADRSEGVAALWKKAASHRCAVDPLAVAIDKALQASVLTSALEPRPSVEMSTGKGLLAQTPYGWFNSVWRTVTNEEWVEALPARVWVDWASTILRLTLGCGYLWEGAWYETIARRVVSGEIPDEWNELVSSVPDTLPWLPRAAGTSVRDVAAPIGWRVRRGELARVVITEWLESTQQSKGMSAMECMAAMAADPELVRKLIDALGSRERTGSANNLWEAIKYALKIRAISGPNADHYGLLGGSGRYLVPTPGHEWTAAVASLACERPGGHTNVGRLQGELGRLGLRPPLSELIWLLERAGMARGSADADQGVEITAAFGEGAA